MPSLSQHKNGGRTRAIYSSRLDLCYSLTPTAPVGKPTRLAADTASTGRRPRLLVTDPDFPRSSGARAPTNYLFHPGLFELPGKDFKKTTYTIEGPGFNSLDLDSSAPPEEGRGV